MLKYENKFKIGDTIRSFDFEPSKGRMDRYIEGVITRIEDHNKGFNYYSAFVIDCTIDTWDVITSPYSRIGEEVFVPMEVSSEYDGRLVKVSI